MITITYGILDAECSTVSTDTENFASLEIFDMIERTRVIEWSHYDEEGNYTGGGAGHNAKAELREYIEMIESRRAA